MTFFAVLSSVQASSSCPCPLLFNQSQSLKRDFLRIIRMQCSWDLSGRRHAGSSPNVIFSREDRLPVTVFQKTSELFSVSMCLGDAERVLSMTEEGKAHGVGTIKRKSCVGKIIHTTSFHTQTILFLLLLLVFSPRYTFMPPIFNLLCSCSCNASRGVGMPDVSVERAGRGKELLINSLVTAGRCLLPCCFLACCCC
jgi:hypothetical protein